PGERQSVATPMADNSNLFTIGKGRHMLDECLIEVGIQLAFPEPIHFLEDLLELRLVADNISLRIPITPVLAQGIFSRLNAGGQGEHHERAEIVRVSAIVCCTSNQIEHSGQALTVGGKDDN